MRRIMFHSADQSGLRIVSGARARSSGVSVFALGPNSGLGGGDKMYALLFDADTGELLSFMGFPFGTAAEPRRWWRSRQNTMARRRFAATGIVRRGRNAFGILKALLSVRPIKEMLRFEPRSCSGGKSSARKAKSCSVSACAAWIIPNKPCAAWM